MGIFVNIFSKRLAFWFPYNDDIEEVKYAFSAAEVINVTNPALNSHELVNLRLIPHMIFSYCDHWPTWQAVWQIISLTVQIDEAGNPQIERVSDMAAAFAKYGYEPVPYWSIVTGKIYQKGTSERYCPYDINIRPESKESQYLYPLNRQEYVNQWKRDYRKQLEAYYSLYSQENKEPS